MPLRFPNSSVLRLAAAQAELRVADLDRGFAAFNPSVAGALVTVLLA